MAAWAQLIETAVFFTIVQFAAIVGLFMRLEKRLTSIENKLGDKDGGLTAQMHDHEERIRALERATNPIILPPGAADKHS